MRKTILLLSAVAVLALPTAASAKHGRHHHHRHSVTVAPAPDPFGPGWRVFWTGVDSFFITPWRTVFVVAPAPVVAKY